MTTTVRKRHLQLQAQFDAAEVDNDTLWTLLNEATRNLYRVNHERAALTVYRQALRRGRGARSRPRAARGRRVPAGRTRWR